MRASLFFLAMACGGCSVLFAVSDDSAAGRDGDDAALDRPDAARSDSEADEGIAVTCPAALGGPAMVPAGTYCIDATEVTVTQYRAVLDAGIAPSVDGPACEDRTAFGEPADGPDGGPARGEEPALVGYCDAAAFCRWAGKRLCGGLDGGCAEISFDASVPNQWLRACYGPSGTVYPYGNEQKPDACGLPRPNLSPVGTHPDCVGAYPGLFDMIGSGGEWVDACRSTWALGQVDCRSRSNRIETFSTAFRCCAR
jgi:formylglycine-generating enzyme required for sulfatase activity